MNEKNNDDLIWGRTNIPEYQVVYRFPDYKKPTLKCKIRYGFMRIKHKIARFIVCIANMIGDKNG